MTTADVVVVGAGLSGLVAADDLRRHGLDVVVVEARSRIGGRVVAVEGPDGLRYEGGGEFVKPTQEALRELATDLGVPLDDMRPAGQFVRIHAGERRIEPRVLADDPAAAVACTEALAAFDAMAAQLPEGEPWKAPRAAQWDAMTVAQWLDPLIADPAARAHVERVLVSGIGGTAPTVSLLQALHYWASAGGLIAQTNPQQQRIRGGGSALAEGLADRLGDRIRLDAAVTRVVTGRSPSGGATVELTNGTTVDADRVVLALSPALAQRITFDPPLPTARVLLQRRWIQGPAIKSFVTYARPWWRDAGLAGMAAGDRDVQFTWDASPDDGSLGIIGALIPLTHRTAAEHFGDAATRHAAVLEHLVAYFGPDAAQPLDVRDVSWAEDPWAGGCGAPLPPGVLAAFGPALRAPIGPLVWAGTETATHGNGSMEGAIEAGHRAAREVAGG